MATNCHAHVLHAAGRLRDGIGGGERAPPAAAAHLRFVDCRRWAGGRAASRSGRRYGSGAAALRGCCCCCCCGMLVSQAEELQGCRRKGCAAPPSPFWMCAVESAHVCLEHCSKGPRIGRHLLVQDKRINVCWHIVRWYQCISTVTLYASRHQAFLDGTTGNGARAPGRQRMPPPPPRRLGASSSCLDAEWSNSATRGCQAGRRHFTANCMRCVQTRQLHQGA